jgi:hypothetical protein
VESDEYVNSSGFQGMNMRIHPIRPAPNTMINSAILGQEAFFDVAETGILDSRPQAIGLRRRGQSCRD